MYWNAGRRHEKGQTITGVGVSSLPLQCNNVRIVWLDSSRRSRLLINRYNGIAWRHPLPAGILDPRPASCLKSKFDGSLSMKVNCLLHVYNCIYCE